MEIPVKQGGVKVIPIPVSFATLKAFYPMRPLGGGLKTFMDELNKPVPKLGPDKKPILGDDGKPVMLQPKNTPCCIQVSHALNLAGQTIPRTYQNARRSNSPITVNGTTNYYLLAVDELELWMTERYGCGMNLCEPADLPRPKAQAIQGMRDFISGLKGILVFRDGGFGLHTELWDGTQILQRDMDETNLFSQPRVLFWYCNL